MAETEESAMKKSHRVRGFGTVFKRANGRYVYQFPEIDGHKKTVTLIDAAGNPIIAREEAETAAEKIFQDISRIRQIDSKVEYMDKVAKEKQLIVQLTVDLPHLWEFYLNQPNRPDSGAVTLESYRSIFELFLKYCRDHQITSLADLSEEVATNYMFGCWQQGISSRTYNKHLQALKLIFKTCVKDNSPFQNLKAKQAETECRKPFTPAQITAIFQKLDEPEYYMLYKPEMRIMMLLGLAFGLRLHDAACFQWSYIEEGAVRFKPAKTRRCLRHELVLPIPPILQNEFALAKEWKRNEYLLPNVAARYKTNSSGISQDISKLLEASGIQTKEAADNGIRRQIYTNAQGERCMRHIGRYSFHSFRHTFCSLAANAGNDLAVIRSIVGHANESMTEHYTHYSLESKRKVIASLPLPQHEKEDGQTSPFAAHISGLSAAKLPRLAEYLETVLSPDQQRELVRQLG